MVLRIWRERGVMLVEATDAAEPAPADPLK